MSATKPLPKVRLQVKVKYALDWSLKNHRCKCSRAHCAVIAQNNATTRKLWYSWETVALRAKLQQREKPCYSSALCIAVNQGLAEKFQPQRLRNNKPTEIFPCFTFQQHLLTKYLDVAAGWALRQASTLSLTSSKLAFPVRLFIKFAGAWKPDWAWSCEKGERGMTW